MVAAIQRRQWLDDLARRRVETAKLRTVCAYVAATMQLADGEDNVMLSAAGDLHLGPGTENPAPAPGPAGLAPEPAPEPVPGNVVGQPAARLPYDRLPDTPPAIRAGQRTPAPAAARPVPLADLGRALGGALL